MPRKSGQIESVDERIGIGHDRLVPTSIATYLTVLGALLVAGVLLSRASARFGVPALLTFLALGMLAGEEGIGRFFFSNYHLSFDISITALVLILFDGGFNTPAARIRSGLAPALTLATLGVVGSSALVGLVVHLVFPFNWAESLLVGSILSSTDAAAVFSILGHAGLQLKKRVGMTLEIESGLNDPMAVLLVSTLTESLVEGRPIGLPAAGMMIAISLVAGVGLGALIGWIAGKLLRIAKPPASALFPVLTMAISFLSFGLATLLGGSGFAAVYVSALILGNVDLPYKSEIRRVLDSLTWLSQLLMFSLLGLLVTPSEAIRMAMPGLAIAFFSALVARPVVALACLAPFRLKLREIAYIGLVGLRGATPIILAIYPVVAHVRGGHEIFNVVFFAVVVNTLFPGAMVGAVARKLGLSYDEPAKPPAILEIISGRILTGGEFLSFTIEDASAVSDALIRDIPMPAESSILFLIRGDEVIASQNSLTLKEGDHVYILCKPADRSFVQLIFGLPETE
jgi:cell volume regulation protein A